MTLLGWLFWGFIATLFIVALLFKRRSHNDSKSPNQIKAEEEARNHPNHHTGGFGGF
ncbi:hypothetical protein [Sediminibacillus massiliensis]|uniref:hypothetical protein n=1 Tax=Sediminibacillus massiliensis TaxID=1926277 RepID=UPI0015C32544|nr:hypothetical protein [Sediminibacillus massiliensis]